MQKIIIASFQNEAIIISEVKQKQAIILIIIKIVSFQNESVPERSRFNRLVPERGDYNFLQLSIFLIVEHDFWSNN
jgi:hypothetical protein